MDVSLITLTSIVYYIFSSSYDFLKLETDFIQNTLLMVQSANEYVSFNKIATILYVFKVLKFYARNVNENTKMCILIIVQMVKNVLNYSVNITLIALNLSFRKIINSNGMLNVKNEKHNSKYKIIM